MRTARRCTRRLDSGIACRRAPTVASARSSSATRSCRASAQDQHLAHVIETLGARGLGLDWAHYVGDDRGRARPPCCATSFARGDLVFSFGGIGATPDDHTRQAAAAALGVPLERHPEAVAEIEAQVRRRRVSAPRADGRVSRPARRSFRIRSTASPRSRSATITSFPAFRRWRGRCSTGCSRRATPTLARDAAGRARDRRLRRRREPAPAADERDASRAFRA